MRRLLQGVVRTGLLEEGCSEGVGRRGLLIKRGLLRGSC